MSRGRAKILAAGALAVWISTQSGGALACACNFTRAYALGQADIAFVGGVISMRTQGDELFAVVEAGRALKGAAPKNLVVSTSRHLAMCGWRFSVGDQLTFSVQLRENVYSTNSCLMGALNPARR